MATPPKKTRSRRKEPAWLDAQEMEIWLAFLESSGRVLNHIDQSIKNRSGLSHEDYEVLAHLSGADGHRLRMTELSHRMIHSQSRLTQRINRMTEQGLVTREKVEDDGRGTFAVLTDAGWKIMQELAPFHVADVRLRLIDLIEEDERPVIAAVLQRVAEFSRDGAWQGRMTSSRAAPRP